jgi:hypothetical protein
MHPIICQVGPLTVYSYGVMLAVAAVVCSVWMARDARRLNIPVEMVFDFYFWVVLAGILGARIFYVLLNWTDYFQFNPVEMVMIQKAAVRRAWRGAAIAAIAGLVLTSVYGSSRLLENFKDDARPFEVVASAVQAHPERPIYVPHDRWTLLLNYHLRYETGFNYYARQPAGSSRLRYLSDLDRASPGLPAYVVLHDRYLFSDTAGRPVQRLDLPNFVLHPPASWRVVVQEQAEPAYNSFALYETEAAPLRPGAVPEPAGEGGGDTR